MEGLDTSVPQTARIWNYLLGGSDNFPADREVGDQMRAAFPEIEQNARQGRAFLIRVVSHLTNAGVRQFLDIGAGLPTVDNTHEIAQRIAPESRIVYVDLDPYVIVQARALLTSSPQGATDYVEADARDTAAVLAAAARTLDLTAPVGLIFSGILGHIADDDEALATVRSYVAALAPGSYLVVLDGSHSVEQQAAETIWNEQANPPYVLRGRDRFARFFDGTTLLDPGVVSAPFWHPAEPDPHPLDLLVGVGKIDRPS